jgi:hypothetical protein
MYGGGKSAEHPDEAGKMAAEVLKDLKAWQGTGRLEGPQGAGAGGSREAGGRWLLLRRLDGLVAGLRPGRTWLRW